MALGALALLAVGSGAAVVVNRMATRAISTPPTSAAAPSSTAFAPDAGMPEQPLRAALAQDAGAAPATPPPAQIAAATADAGTAGERSAPAPAPKMATLLVTAIPYASVYVDGRLQPGDFMGTRPIRIPAGKHHVRLTHEIGSKDFYVTLAPGEKQAVSHTFIR